MKDVVWLSVDKKVPADAYWDMSLLKELLKGCKHHYSIGSLQEAIVVIPGQKQGKHIKKINKELSKLKRCKVVITSDEANDFPTDSLSHPDMQIYSQYYNPKYDSDIRWLPIGPAKINEHQVPVKDLNWFFAGQVNNESRRELVKILSDVPNGMLVSTEGFSQGLPQDEYYDHMERAKVVPAPMGVVSQDSFRFYEALEAGAIPVVIENDFWEQTLKERCYVSTTSWDTLQNIYDTKFYNSLYQAAWMREKLRIKSELVGESDLTVVIPCSPIPSHPSTEIIDETIASIRHHLPDVKIIVTFDGVREEQAHMKEAYDEFIRRFLWKYNNKDVYPIIFTQHTHQVRMCREALEHIDTPLLMYVEQDTPLVTDAEIPFAHIMDAILGGKSNLIRLHHESSIPEEHNHMMLGTMILGIDLRLTMMATCQWSQRPHIASRAFYRRILNDYFSEDATSFIEDKMHGVVHEAYEQDGIHGWDQFKIYIYHPEGNIKRSYHTDGRAGTEKYDDTQVF